MTEKGGLVSAPMWFAADRRLVPTAALFLLLAVAAVVGAWLWNSRSEVGDRIAVEGNFSPSTAPVPTEHAAVPRSPVGAAATSGAAPEQARRRVVSSDRALDPAGPKIHDGRLRGRVLLQDDVPLADWPIRIESHDQTDGKLADPVVTTTDGDGRFDLPDLEPGVYRIADASGLVGGYARGHFDSGDAEHRVVFGVYRLTVRVASPTGEPVPGVRVAVDSYPSGGGPSSRLTTRTSDGDGAVRWFLRSPGLATLSAFDEDGALQARREGIVIAPGVSARDELLVLVPADTSAALRVRVRCAETGEEVPFLAWMRASGSDVVVRSIWSEDTAAGGGYVHGLPVGEFDIILSHRYRMPFSFYELPGHSHVRRVVLRPFESTDVEFSIPCGGRLRLHIAAPGSVAGAAPADHATARLIAEEATEGRVSRLMVITDRFADGRSSVREDIPIGREVVSHTVVPQGFYVLEVRAEGYRDQTVPVYVVAGELTNVAVLLEQELR